MSSNTTLSNFNLQKEDVISERLNVILQNFAENDSYIYGKFDQIPGIWKCLWYNDPNIKGYKKGDFVWLNTESKVKFLKNNAEEIREAADINPMITKKLPVWRSNDQEVFDEYNNVLTGYIDSSKSSPMQPYAELGTLSACVQLVISQKNNNKDTVNKSSWKKFIVDDFDAEVAAISASNVATSAIIQHELDYHFGQERLSASTYNERFTKAVDSLNTYANADFSNVKNMYPLNYFESGFHCHGFDTVEMFVRKPYPDRAISGYTIEYQWFRKWRSGFLEHGGLLKTSNCRPEIGNTIDIQFDWNISGTASQIYAVKYLTDQDSKLIEIDESGDIPPGDNVLSVLYEMDPEAFAEAAGIRRCIAPSFYDENYDLNLTPIYKTAGLTAVSDTAAYENIGNYAAVRNVVNTSVKTVNYKRNGISLEYDSANTPEYYTYYATGFWNTKRW